MVRRYLQDSPYAKRERRRLPLIDKQKRAGFLKCINKSEIPALSASWAQRFFHGCAGGNYFKTGHPGTVLDFEVKLTEAMVAAAVVELAHLRQNQSKWNFRPKAIALFNLYQNTPV